MVTPSELLRVVLVPVLVAAAIAAIGRWRRWAWAMPLAAGAGFIVGYALIGVPRLPPVDGNDWLFWLAIPATLLGMLDAWLQRRWGWALGAAGAALVTFVIVLPLLRSGTVTPLAAAAMCAATAVAGAALCVVLDAAEPRVGAWAVVVAACIATGAASVVVMSSGLRILGVYGIAAAAALGPVAVLVAGRRPARGVAVLAVSVLAGVLSASWHYGYPGVSLLNFAVLMAAPALLALAAIIPAGKREWMRGVLGVAAVAIAVAAVTVPTALSAKREAESTRDDPYADYYGQ